MKYYVVVRKDEINYYLGIYFEYSGGCWGEIYVYKKICIWNNMF